MANIIFIALLCLGTALAEHSIRTPPSACRDVANQTCQAFEQCCTRRCYGEYEASCTGNSISLAICRCTGPVKNDYTERCNGTLGVRTCDEFGKCCYGLCPDADFGCRTNNDVVTSLTCFCRASDENVEN